MSVIGDPPIEELLQGSNEALMKIIPEVNGEVQDTLKLVALCLQLVEREMKYGPHIEADYKNALPTLGVNSDSELVQGIRQGLYDNAVDKIIPLLIKLTELKIKINNPKYLENIKREREMLQKRKAQSKAAS